MHPSDRLVLGPLPLLDRSVRVPLGAVGLTVLVLLLMSAVVLVALDAPLAEPVHGLALGLIDTASGRSVPTPAASGLLTNLTSSPEGALVLVDGHVVGQTPTAGSFSGHAVVLRRQGASEVTLLDPNAGIGVPIWPRPRVLQVRAPLPGGAITDLTVLEDGRLALAVASAAGPGARRAWVLDPGQARVERVGPATHDDAPPAGVVVAADGQHSAVLMRGAATATGPAAPDTLLLDGPEGRRPLLGDGVLGRDERVRDLTWAPDGRSALLVTQRPIPGAVADRALFRVRQVSLTGPSRDLVDLPVAPIEGSWVWAPDGHAVAFLVRGTPTVLATLDVDNAALRSVADEPAELLPSASAIAPAAWAADGTLLFAAPDAEQTQAVLPTPGTTVGTPRPVPVARLEALAPGRTDPHLLGNGAVLATAPAVGSGTTLLALARSTDGTLLIRTLDAMGQPVAEQSLEVRAVGALSVRWDLPHAQLVVLQNAAQGGIDARVLRFDGEATKGTR
jgi:hypothetical protein